MVSAPKTIKLIILDNQVIVAPITEEKISEAFEIDAPLAKATSVLKKRFSPASIHVILATSQSGSEMVTLTSEKQSLIKDLDSHITSLTIKDQDMLIYSWETIKETDSESHIQLFGATKKHLQSLNSIFQKAGLTPISLESLSSVIARLESSENPTAIHYPCEKDVDLLLVAHQGKLLGEVKIRKPEDIPVKFEILTSRLKALGMELTKIILDDDVPQTFTDQYQQLKIATEIKPIEPLHVALIQDKSGSNPIATILESQKLPPEQLAPKTSETISKTTKSPKWLLFSIGGGVVVIAAIIGGILVSTNSLQKLNFRQMTSSSTPIPTVIPSPTPTPTPKLLTPAEKADYTLIIQNGSGIPGTAATAQELLEDLGYVVDSVANADNYDYQGTIIQTSKPLLFNSLKSDLEEYYSVASEAAEIGDNKTTDAIVIIGSE